MMFESEERQIAERIKDFTKSKDLPEYYYIMLRNGRILDINNYRKMVNSGKINPHDAYVYIGIGWSLVRSGFHYPFLAWYLNFLKACLSKLGFYYDDFVVPATGLKYVAAAVGYGEYLSIEVTNLDTVVNNLNLRKIVYEVLGDKLVSGEKELTEDEYEKIYEMYKSQRPFAGYDFNEALDIIYSYYKGNQSLAKEVARTGIDYYRIFNPYTVCYETRTWKEIDCLSINLD